MMLNSEGMTMIRKIKEKYGKIKLRKGKGKRMSDGKIKEK